MSNFTKFKTTFNEKDILYALEAEYDFYFGQSSFQWQWSHLRNEYFIYENFAYYYKPIIEENYEMDEKDVLYDYENNIDLEYYTKNIRENLKIDIINVGVKYKELLEKKPKGFPKFEDETVSFFRLESVGPKSGGKLIELEDINKENMDLIRDSFSDDLNPYISNMYGNLYKKDNKMYYTSVYDWYVNPIGKWGILMDTSKPSNKYANAEETAFFFSFEKLTEEQKKVVKEIYESVRNESTKKLVVINYDLLT